MMRSRPNPSARATWALACFFAVLGTVPPPGASALAAAEAPWVVVDDQPLTTDQNQPTLRGRSNAPAGTPVEIRLGDQVATTQLAADGSFTLVWPTALEPGVYQWTVRVAAAETSAETTVDGWIRRAGTLPRRPIEAAPTDFQLPVEPQPRDFYEITDRWRLLPGLAEQDAACAAGSSWFCGLRRDPYPQNRWKGDAPLPGSQNRFLIVTGASDTLVDLFRVPIPSPPSSQQPGNTDFFGDGDLGLLQQNLTVAVDYYQGSTAFKPIEWRFKAAVVANGNHLEANENAVVGPDVRRGKRRTRGFLALQELYYERKLKDLSEAFDFLSLRVGIQPFSSDFRGFVFTDTNFGVRLFGNAHSNRYQYNVAFFERLEKDTNSGLNQFERRHQRVLIANAYRQDTFVKGYTAQLSLHLLQDDDTLHLDDNGFLARPDPVGSAKPHTVEAAYFGFAGFGHFGRLNVDHAFYLAVGEDSLNPIAGRDIFARRDDVDIAGQFAAIELSYDRDWLRPRFAVLYSSGDDDPTDRDAEGFAPIFDNPAFAGGGFSYWNRLGIRLAGTAVSLVNRGSLVPDLRSNKEEGQPNFVNPGLLLLSLGLDAELTPKLKLVTTANYLRFDETATLELLTFQPAIDREIGLDLSVGVRFRPRLDNNIVLVGGVAALLPGDGFSAIYEDPSTLYGAFANFTLVY